ncbi:MAG: DUF5655 domain-containing protein [Candidatus Acidiferrales bacterium]
MHACRPAVPVAEHFAGKSPRVRGLYRALKAAVDKIGRVGVDSTKTRIAFHLQTIFLELQPGKDTLRGMLVLPQPARHPTFRQAGSLSPRIHYHWFALTDPKQIDAPFRRLLAEGFKVGRREHLKISAQGKQKVSSPSPQAPAWGKSVSPGGGSLRAREIKRRRTAFVDTGRPLWRCPKCGNYFVSRNLPHSCVRVSLDDHFKGTDPIVRKTYNAFLAALRRNGPVRVVSSKTRITFMVRMRFAGATPQKNALRCGFALLRPARHPAIRRAYRFPGTQLFAHELRLTHPDEIDAPLRRLLAEAYRVGCQAHLQSRG